MRIVASLILCLLAASARADAFFKRVGHRCDPAADRLVSTCDAAANGEITTRAASVAGRAEPNFTRLPAEELLSDTSPLREAPEDLQH